MEKYLLNIKSGKIHNTENLCPYANRMAEENKKWFDTYEEAEDFFTGKKKGCPCGICMKQ